jgi:carboxypeptidase family protein
MSRPRHFGLRISNCGLTQAVFRSLLFLALCSWPIAAALAQSSTATVSGTVEDQNGAVVPGVSITIQNRATSLERHNTTNDNGQFTISLLSPGTYTITARHDGFTTAEIRDVVLNVGDQKAFQVQLKTGNVNETVNVTAEAPLISESPAVSTVVDRQFVENIPLNGRSFQTLFQLTPGVVLTAATPQNQGQFSVNGQRPDANYFMVDGAGANLGVNLGTPGQTPGGTTPALGVTGGTNSLVSVDAMQEFRIQTSTFAPEFGRMPGGQISISTRSGTNQFHATAFEYFRNDKLDANDWFNNRGGLRKPAERQNDFGSIFHGPIIKDRAFFFFSFEGLRLRQPRTAVMSVPSTNSVNPTLNRSAAVPQMQPFLNAFPISNGPDLGSGLAQFTASYSDPSTLNAYSIRLDHAINSRLNFFARYNYAPSKADVRQTGASSVASNQQALQINTHTFTLGLTQIIAPQLNNEFRFNLSNVKGTTAFFTDNFGGAVPLTDAQMFPSGQTSANSFLNIFILGAGLFVHGNNSVLEQRQVNFVDNVSLTQGSHQMKFGVDYRWLAPIYGGFSYTQSITFLGMTGATGALGGVASSASVGAFQETTCAWHGQSRVFSRGRIEHGYRHPAPSIRPDVFVFIERRWPHLGKPTTGPFLDWTSATVDRTQGANRGRLYIFSNWVSDSWGLIMPGRPSLLTSSDAGRTFTGPVFPAPPATFLRDGIFPRDSVVLDDGTVLSILLGTRYQGKGFLAPDNPTSGAVKTFVEAIRSTDGGRTLGDPIVVGDSPVGLATSMTFDRKRGKIYVVWTSGDIEYRSIMLARSTDRGTTWLSNVAIQTNEGNRAVGLGDLWVAVNGQGLVGLVWPAENGTCTRFAVSVDQGRTFGTPVDLNPCAQGGHLRAEDYSASIQSAPVLQRLPGQRQTPDLALSMRLYNPSFVNTGLLVDVSGRFHPIWPERREGLTELWTRGILVGQAPSPSISVDNLTNISKLEKIRLTNNRFHTRSSTFFVDVTLLNNSAETICGPVRIVANGLRSDYGTPEIDNADNGIRGEGAIWDMTDDLEGGVIRPWSTSMPRTLAFRIKNLVEKDKGDPVIIGFKIFGKIGPACSSDP